MKRSLALPLVMAIGGTLLPLASRALAADDAVSPATSASTSGSASASASAVAIPVATAVTEASAAPAGSSSSSAATSSSAHEDASDMAPRKKRALATDKAEDPLAIPEGVKTQIGPVEIVAPRPEGDIKRTPCCFPLVYRERIGRVVTSAFWPLYYDRKEESEDGRVLDRQTVAVNTYFRRSEKHDTDAVFPFYFHWRDDNTYTTVIPPILWSDGPKGEWHRWLAPLVFAGADSDGGYFHAPLLLTTSHHSKKKAFSLIGGIGFYDRNERDVDWGVAPFVFGGHNDDKLTNYFVIPPLLTYHRQDKDAGKETTLVGPVYSRTTPTSTVLDVFPLFFHNHGTEKGASYSTTGLLPFFWASRGDQSQTLGTPLFFWSKDKESSTLVTWLYSRHRGRTSLDLAGPIVPLWAHWSDPDLFKESNYVFPVYWSKSPTGSALFTPLFGQWREAGVSQTTWVFPSFVHTADANSWSFNFHPLVYVGADKESSHTVIAPFYFDFIGAHYRTTVGFPLFWRFRDDDGVTQVAANTLYMERKAGTGKATDFYFLPIVHVGDQPDGNSWDVLFGLVGYKRVGTYKQLQLFWTSIDLTPDPNAPKPATKGNAFK